MWIFCKSGMFSAVKHNKKEGIYLVRTRLEGDLERLFKAHGLENKYKAVETPEADYRFRVEMSVADWVKCVSEEADTIDYGNFKNGVHDGTVRDEAYLGCWVAMLEAQTAQKYGKREKRGKNGSWTW